MKMILFSLLCVISLTSVAQTCVNVTAPDTSDRFITHIDGTITDTLSGLMWQRCSYGQTYNQDSESCEGAAQQITWQQALQAAVDDKTAGHSDWQVPNIKELASIVNHNCVTPAINETVFIDTKSNNYWSSSTDRSAQQFAWVYQFADGKNNLTEKSADAFLRFVRYAQ
ncbi:DUF1566 domain-containing protein [Pseudoalteromonas sp. T1lg65]|uniref:Lcl C-terminal domain-containing protein n=1 Tax=Pseudoalteromonas sp. T1lg65 TaxID=2077101 RepID=UPI003F7A2A4F